MSPSHDGDAGEDDIERKSDGDPMVSALLEDNDEYHCPECGEIARGITYNDDGSEEARCRNGHKWDATESSTTEADSVDQQEPQ